EIDQKDNAEVRFDDQNSTPQILGSDPDHGPISGLKAVQIVSFGDPRTMRCVYYNLQCFCQPPRSNGSAITIAIEDDNTITVRFGNFEAQRQPIGSDADHGRISGLAELQLLSFGGNPQAMRCVYFNGQCFCMPPLEAAIRTKTTGESARGAGGGTQRSGLIAVLIRLLGGAHRGA